jgi:hypothetical protein
MTVNRKGNAMSLWSTLKDLFNNLFNGPPSTAGVSDKQLEERADMAGQQGEWISERSDRQELLDRMSKEPERQSDSERNPSYEPGHIGNHEPGSHGHGSGHDQHHHHDHASRAQHHHGQHDQGSRQDHGSHHEHGSHQDHGSQP